MVRIVLAIFIFCLGLWMFYTISYAIGYAAARGGREWAELANDPKFLLRFGGAVLATLGGAVSFMPGLTGPLITGLGAIGIGMLVVTLLLKGDSGHVWQPEAVNAGALILLTAGRAIFGKN